MCRTSFLLVLVAFILALSAPTVGSAYAQGVPAFDAAGTDAQHVTSFLKTLQSAVAIDNRLKVGTLVEYPLTAWAGGRVITIRNESEFQARYSQVFDSSPRKSIADARPEGLTANQSGVTCDNGRLLFRPVAERKNALKIVAINEPGQAR